jgi:hypothetical protein
MNAQQAAIDDNEKALASESATLDDNTGALLENATARTTETTAIRAMTEALLASRGALSAETEVLLANSAAWARSGAARGEALGASAVGGEGRSAALYDTTAVGANVAQVEAQAQRLAKARASIGLESATIAGASGAQASPSALEDAAAAVAASQPVPPNVAAIRRAAELNANPVPPQERIKGPGTYLGERGAVRLGEQGASAPIVVGSSGTAALNATRDATFGGTAAIGQYTAAETEMVAVNNEVVSSLERVAEAQAAANAEFNLSVGEYAASSQALTAHGALSTEFISGLVRGEVTLQEFGTALTATIGKFAGWAVAGGAVYAAFEGGKKIIEGATSTATGVAQLERAIPNLNKPEAERGFRSNAAQTNVSIKEAAEAQFFAARSGFHTQDESHAVAKTVILASKLDEVPIQDAAKSLGALKVAFGLNAEGIRDVFNELDVGQLKFNARLNQTLPQLGRAASSFANAGGTVQQLTRQLVQVTGATGGGGGQGGGNPATLFIREATNVARPAAIETLRQFGFNPNQATEHIGNFNEELQKRAAIKPGQPGYLSTEDIRELAKAIGAGGAIGGRYGIALINGGRTGRAGEIDSELSKAGPAAEEDLSHKLHQFNEQLSTIGHTFERVGSEVGEGGVTKVLETFLELLTLLTEGLEVVAEPLEGMGNALNEIPGPLLDIALATTAIGVASKVVRSDKGVGVSQVAGQVPGLGFLESDNKKSLQALQRTNSEGLSYQRQQVARATATKLSASSDLVNATNEKARFAAGPQGQRLQLLTNEGYKGVTEDPADQEVRALQARSAAYDQQIQGSQDRLNKSEQVLLSGRETEDTLTKKKADLSDNSKSVQERLNKAEQENAVAATAGKPGIPLRSGYGTVGTAAQIAGQDSVLLAEQSVAADARLGGEQIATSLTGVAAATDEGAAEVRGAFATAAAAISESGVAVGLRGAAGSAAGGASSLLSSVKGNLFQGLITAYIGSAIADALGSAIGGKTGSTIGGIGADVAVGAGVGTLFGSPEIGAGLGAAYGASKYLGGNTQQTLGKIGTAPTSELDLLRKIDAANKIVSETEYEHLGPADTLHNISVAGGLLGENTAEQGKRAEREKKKYEGQLGRNQLKLSSGASNSQVNLETAAEGFGEEIEKAFANESETAKKALAVIEKHNKIVAANLKLFGRSAQGQTANKEAVLDLQKEIEDLVKNPGTKDVSLKAIEEQFGTLNTRSKEEFTYSAKTATSPKQVQDALRAAQIENQKAYSAIPATEKGYQERLATARSGISGSQDHLKQLEAGPQTPQSKSEETRTKAILKAYEAEVKKVGGEIKTFHEAKPGLERSTNELAESQAAEAYKAKAALGSIGDTRKLAEAGNNPVAKLKVEKEIRDRNSKYAKETFTGGRPGEVEELKKVHEETATGAINERTAKETEALEKIERGGSRQIASLPASAPKSQSDAIRVQTEQARVSYIKGHLNATGGQKALEEAEIKLDEAKRGREESVSSEAKEIVSLRGQIEEAGSQGNATAQAQEAYATAQQLLAVAKTAPERLQAQLALVQAVNQIQQALEANIQASGELKESTELNPLTKDKTKINTTRQQLAAAKGPDEKKKFQTQLNGELVKYQQDSRNEREEIVGFQLSIGDITNEQASETLQELLKGKDLTASERRKIEGEIYKYQTEGQDFGVGNIKNPNLYDAKTLTNNATKAANRAATPSTVNFSQVHAPPQLHQTNHINVNVSGGHAGKVVKELEKAFHTTTKSQLRSARLT